MHLGDKNTFTLLANFCQFCHLKNIKKIRNHIINKKWMIFVPEMVFCPVNPLEVTLFILFYLLC